MDKHKAEVIVHDQIKKHLSISRICKEPKVAEGHVEVAEALSMVLGEAGLGLLEDGVAV